MSRLGAPHAHIPCIRGARNHGSSALGTAPCAVPRGKHLVQRARSLRRMPAAGQAHSSVGSRSRGSCGSHAPAPPPSLARRRRLQRVGHSARAPTRDRLGPSPLGRARRPHREEAATNRRLRELKPHSFVYTITHGARRSCAADAPAQAHACDCQLPPLYNASPHGSQDPGRGELHPAPCPTRMSFHYPSMRRYPLGVRVPSPRPQSANENATAARPFCFFAFPLGPPATASSAQLFVQI